MINFLSSIYLWIKAFHVMAVISWMAGLFYLPRLFVYHTSANDNGECSETFPVMERKLYKYIMQPAMIASWIAGLLMIAVIGFSDIWLHVKLTMVILLTVYHFWLGRMVVRFARGENDKPEKFYRMINEIPTLLMIVIVIMVIVKPF